MVPLAISRNALISLLPTDPRSRCRISSLSGLDSKGRKRCRRTLRIHHCWIIPRGECARARCPRPRTGPNSTGVSDLYPYRSGLCSPARIPLFFGEPCTTSCSSCWSVERSPTRRRFDTQFGVLTDGSFSTLSRSHRSDTVATPLGAGDSPTRLLLGRQQWRPLSKVATHISIAARRPHLRGCGLNAASVQLSPPSVDTSTVLIPRVPA